MAAFQSQMEPEDCSGTVSPLKEVPNSPLSNNGESGCLFSEESMATSSRTRRVCSIAADIVQIDILAQLWPLKTCLTE